MPYANLYLQMQNGLDDEYDYFLFFFVKLIQLMFCLSSRPYFLLLISPTVRCINKFRWRFRKILFANDCLWLKRDSRDDFE